MLDVFIHKYLHVPYVLHVHADSLAKSSPKTVVLLHGLGNSGASWDAVVKRLPENTRVISIDLLGFGESPSPRWMKYDITIQARSVARTLSLLNIRSPLIIVGHSMGSLVAIELAKRYSLFIHSLILCSPPIYKPEEKKQILLSQTDLLRQFYRSIIKQPQSIVRIAPLAAKLQIVGKAFNVTEKNVDIYMAVLESSILNQTSIEDIVRIKKPIHLIHGILDPVVIKRNLDGIVKTNPYVSLKVIPAGHEMLGAYIPATAAAITKAVRP